MAGRPGGKTLFAAATHLELGVELALRLHVGHLGVTLSFRAAWGRKRSREKAARGQSNHLSRFRKAGAGAKRGDGEGQGHSTDARGSPGVLLWFYEVEGESGARRLRRLWLWLWRDRLIAVYDRIQDRLCTRSIRGGAGGRSFGGPNLNLRFSFRKSSTFPETFIGLGDLARFAQISGYPIGATSANLRAG